MSSERPRIAILFLTYIRTDYALRTIRGILDYLEGCERRWYVADDGSSRKHHSAVMAALEGEELIGEHNERLGAGASWNRGLDACFHEFEILLYLEDDWELLRQFDISPYIALLQEVNKVGMVRLGYIPTGLDCHTEGYFGNHYLRIEKTTPYQFSGNPALRHRRFHTAYGLYPLNHNPGDTEVVYDELVRRNKRGPEIWWPIDLGGWGIFQHIGEKQSY